MDDDTTLGSTTASAMVRDKGNAFVALNSTSVKEDKESSLNQNTRDVSFSVSTNRGEGTAKNALLLPPTSLKSHSMEQENVTVSVANIPTELESPKLNSTTLTPVTMLPAISVAQQTVPTKPVPTAPASLQVNLIITKDQGILGFGVIPLQGNSGVQVSTLQPDSSAFKAGLRIGDVLVKLDTTIIRHMRMSDIVPLLQKIPQGGTVHLQVSRRQQQLPFSSISGVSLPPPPKKAKPSITMSDISEMKKKMGILTKALAESDAERTKLSERNASLRKRMQEMVILADEKLLSVQATMETKIQTLRRENAILETALATLRAQDRLDSRAVFDTSVTNELKRQLEQYKGQLEELAATEKDRRESRKRHGTLQSQLAGIVYTYHISTGTIYIYRQRRRRRRRIYEEDSDHNPIHIISIDVLLDCYLKSTRGGGSTFLT